MSFLRLRPLAFSLLLLSTVTCGGEATRDSSNDAGSGGGSLENTGGGTQGGSGGGTQEGTGGVTQTGSGGEGEFCTVASVDNLGGAPGEMDCSELEVAASGCSVVSSENTVGTGGALNTTDFITEGTYLLTRVEVFQGLAEAPDLLGREFEGTLVISSSGPDAFNVESDLRGPMGHFEELSSWHFEGYLLTPTKYCGDPTTFLGFPLPESRSAGIHLHDPDTFSFLFYIDGVEIDFKFVRAGTDGALRRPLEP